MGEGNEEAVTSGSGTRWLPPMGSQEWYSRWALDNMAPCEGCSPEYRQAYGRLQGAVSAADSCFQLGYRLYSELSRIGHEE